MAISRQRLLTLAYGDMETIRMVRISSLYYVISVALTIFQLPNSYPVRSVYYDQPT